MFPPRSTFRPAIACVLACAMLASTMSGAAVAKPIDEPMHDPATSLAQQDLRSPDARDAASTSSLAGTTSTTPQQDLRSPDARDAASSSTAAVPHLDLRNPDARALAIARAQERYYSSYAEPLASPAPPAPADGDTPWLPIGLAIAATLAIVAAGGAHFRRLRIRRRRTARVTA